MSRLFSHIKIKRLWQKLFAVVFSLFIFSAAIHKAEASFEHQNHTESCEICSWSKNFTYTDLEQQIILEPTVTLTDAIVFYNSGSQFDTRYSDNKNSPRGPPAVF